VDGVPITKSLDIRVQPGGVEAEKLLIDYGKKFNIPASIKSIGG